MIGLDTVENTCYLQRVLWQCVFIFLWPLPHMHQRFKGRPWLCFVSESCNANFVAIPVLIAESFGHRWSWDRLGRCTQRTPPSRAMFSDRSRASAHEILGSGSVCLQPVLHKLCVHLCPLAWRQELLWVPLSYLHLLLSKTLKHKGSKNRILHLCTDLW